MKTTLKTFLKHCQGTPETHLQANGTFDIYAKPAPFSYTWVDDVYGSGVYHRGWYTDPDGTTYKDGTGIVRGFVASLPASPGFPSGRFLAGYWWGGSDRWNIHPRLYSDAARAASEADSEAEKAADAEREYQEKWQAARDVEDKIQDLLIRARELWLLRHAKSLPYVRVELTEVIEDIREKRERLEAEFEWVR